jgi:uncharacterized LabA/DUF88 family protein
MIVLKGVQCMKMNDIDTKINIAYIDAANLNIALKLSLSWKMDYRKFRIWLEDKYEVKRAYIFIGFMPQHTNLYTNLQNSGFTLVFKDVLFNKGVPKGNCDSDLIIQATTDLYEGDLNKAVIVSSDGDFAPLIKKLLEKDKLEVILSPSRADKCSILLKRTSAPIAYIDDQKSILSTEKPNK